MKAKKTKQDEPIFRHLEVLAEPVETQGESIGDVAPKRKDFLRVLIIFLILIALSWSAYHFFGRGR